MARNSKLTYKDLFTQVNDLVSKQLEFINTQRYRNQLGRTDVAPLASNGISDVRTADIITSIQSILNDALPGYIISGLNVEATNPVTNEVTVTAGKGSKGGRVFELKEDITLEIPFDDETSVYYISLYLDRIIFNKSVNDSALILAKIIAPEPGVSYYVYDKKEDRRDAWDAYINTYQEIKFHGDKYGNLEEESLQYLRNNIGPILADNLIGNLRLSENLKITNTQGSLELDSKSLKILTTSGTTVGKFNRYGTFFYDNNGIEVARFSTDSARIGNIVIETDSIHSGNFVSGALGSGFKIQDSGDAEFQNVKIRGKITSSVFEKETINAVGGNLLVIDSDILDADMSALDSSKLTISGDTAFSIGDVLRIKDNTDDEWLQVTAVNSNTYTVTRDKNSAYTADNNPTWTKGTTVVNYGQSGEGAVFMTSSESNAPYIDILTHTGSPWTTSTTKVRLGNLAGINDSDYGSLSGYGLFADNVYLKGSLFAPNIKTANSGSRIELTEDGIIAYDASNNKSFSVLLTDISGYADTGDVIIGSVADDNYLHWDESAGTLTVHGNLNVLSGGDSNFVSTVQFSAETDDDKVSWTSGNIAFSDGSTVSIDSGQTGVISQTTWIYYDEASGAGSTLQTTNTYTSAVGTGKTPLIVIEPSESGGSNPTFKDALARGTAISGSSITTGFILADRIQTGSLDANKITSGTITATQIAAGTITATEIAANTITAGNIAASTITASEIASGTITATQIASSTITADKMNISQLDAIQTNTGTLTVDEYIEVGSDSNGPFVFIDGVNQSFKVFGDTITIENNVNDDIDWEEDFGGEISGVLTSGTYTPTTLAAEIEDVMTTAGDTNTTVTYNSTTRKITISNSSLSSLSFLWASGTHADTNCGRAAGFDVTEDDDTSGTTSWTSDVQVALRVEMGLLQ